MGLFRFLLAMTVVMEHLHLKTAIFGDSRFAVQSFFLISGFYIAMVWESKYSNCENPIRTFYLSRALRIYPLYLLVLMFSVLVSWYGLSSGHISALMAILGYPLSGIGSMSVYLPQISILGMDVHAFLARIDSGEVVFASPFTDYPRPLLIEYMFVPQAWTLSLELMFYIVAPFVLSKTSLQISLLILSLAMRLVLWKFGFNYQPWTTGIFPLEVALFLAGSLAHQVFGKTKLVLGELVDNRIFASFMVASPVALAAFASVLVRYLGEAAYWICYALTLLALPFLFQASKTLRLDRMLGELSYPIYLSHWLVVTSLFMLDISAERYYPMAILITVLFGAALNTIQSRIDRYRHSLASNVVNPLRASR